MRTPKRLILSVALVTLIGVAPVRAFDGPVSDDASASDDRGALPIFKNAKAALREGLESLKTGHIRLSIPALQYAAQSGESLAQWKLGKMYAAGEGVPHDDAKAFDYFAQIVNGYDEDDSDPRESSVVASAFVALGAYNLNGVANTRILPNPDRALEMFHYAAVYFGDANAQYNLGRMYLDGNAVNKDGRQAARWLYLAADKGHIESEAVLGQLLFKGYDGVPPQRAKGLMWLSLAHEGVTDKVKERWILELYNRAMAAASAGDRRAATAYLEDHTRRRN